MTRLADGISYRYAIQPIEHVAIRYGLSEEFASEVFRSAAQGHITKPRLVSLNRLTYLDIRPLIPSSDV
jgi:hypothetical protein